MGWFGRFRRRPTPPTGGATAQTAADLRSFIATHDGIEAFVEPQTSVYATTLLLVAGDGEPLRRPVADAAHARKLCSELGVPLYDARLMGYPERMRAFERGERTDSIGLDQLPPMNVVDE